ncbi:protoporphyrinogen/coproporphyrinogen oxidase, partial [Thermodesulfobacteriota bacterium]
FDRWLPYPFQNNIRHLPREALYECLQGLHKLSGAGSRSASNFREWIYSTFGEGIARHFMIPYNAKVWSTPLDIMSKDWIAERVSVVDFERVLKNVILEQDDVSWGPNNKFKFPLHGGTGSIFRRAAKNFGGHLTCEQDLLWVDTETRTVTFRDGTTVAYDALISTIPVDQLVKKIKRKPDPVAAAAMQLVANRGIVIGIGYDRPDDSNKNWMYFPEGKNPCYRVTYFSNYSPRNVPDITKNFSLMGEISYPRGTTMNENKAVENTIQGFINTGLMTAEDRDRIKTVFTIDLDYSYPVPTIGRDRALATIQPYLENLGIYSRGRFGAWQYEIGNMDHSVMQGIEVVDRILSEKRETVLDMQQVLLKGAA